MQRFQQLLLGLLLLSTGCTVLVSEPTPVLVTDVPPSATVVLPTTTAQPPTSTSTVLPPTSIPSTATPLPTTPPTLQTNGPYLVYWKNTDTQTVAVMDANGSGQIEIQLPEANVGLDLSAAVSPDGRWLAYYSGKGGECFTSEGAGPYDLALNILEIKTGTRQTITTLLSADYPANFEALAKRLGQPDSDAFILRDAFTCGIKSLAWSPDSQHLAFAGQMDGLSSDLYVYDVSTQAIRRLTDGLEQIQFIEWSPDGQWIVHSSTNQVGEGAGGNFHAAKVDGSEVKNNLSASPSSSLEWIGPTTYLQWQRANGIGSHALEMVDIVSGKTQIIWPSAFDFHIVDLTLNAVILSGPENFYRQDPWGLYWVDLMTGQFHKLNDGVWAAKVTGLTDKPLWAFDRATEQAFYILADGTFQLAETQDWFFLSPQHQYKLVLGDDLQVYTLDDVLVRSIQLPYPVKDIQFEVWLADETAFFFIEEGNLYRVEIGNGEVRLLDTNLGYSWDVDLSLVANP